MPVYNPAIPGPAIYPGDTVTVVNAESRVAGDASQQVVFGRDPIGLPAKFSVDLQFSADPGTFELDVQTADFDTAADYQNYPVSGTITAVDGNFRASAQFVNIVAKFGRVYFKTLTNAVKTTINISR